MPEFKSEGGLWQPKNQAAKDFLKERGIKTIGSKSKTSYQRGYGIKPKGVK